jgi:hypothetical protein
MRVHKFALSAGAGLVALGVPVLVTTSSASASASASTPAIINLSNSNNGATITVPMGAEVDVHLHGTFSDTANWKWTVPVSSDNGVLAFERGGTDAQGDAWADFVARSGGTATITSTESCVLVPGRACPMLVLLWRATLTVSPAPTLQP